jgi:hypothetical protein
MGLTACLRNG